MSDLHLLLEDQILTLRRYAFALTRDIEQADDLVEDTIIEARRRPYLHGSDMRLRLLTILHEQRANPFRHADPMAVHAGIVTDPAAQPTLSDLDRALGQLPEAQRAVILLIGLEGLSYGQTAAVLDISVGTMRSRLARGRENLRRALGAAEEHEFGRAA